VHLVEADQALLHQAVYNLVENAIKYTTPLGKVTIRTLSQPEHLIFAIEDSGIGIPVEDIPHLFEKFYRGKQREARSQPGSGLGLATAQKILEAYQVTLKIDTAQPPYKTCLELAGDLYEVSEFETLHTGEVLA
jgi:signal transduction histidine kinase